MNRSVADSGEKIINSDLCFLHYNEAPVLIQAKHVFMVCRSTIYILIAIFDGDLAED